MSGIGREQARRIAKRVVGPNPATVTDERLDGCTALVTGASTGIGQAVAEAYVARGARIVVTATREGNLDQTMRRCARVGHAPKAVALDLADEASVRAAAAASLEHLGEVDLLVNNAGIHGNEDGLACCPMDEFERVMAVNVTGTLRLTQLVLPAMRPGGVVINVTSGAAGNPGSGAYGVTKLALDGVTAILRPELAARGLRCSSVDPRGTRTPMRARAFPEEDPETVPHPDTAMAPFLALASGLDAGPRLVVGQRDRSRFYARR